MESRSVRHPTAPPPSVHQDPSLSRPVDTRPSRLGLPRFDWSVTLLGLCVFTFAIVTYRFPVAEAGIAIAAIGLVLQRTKVALPSLVWIYGGFVLWAFVASFASHHPEVATEQVLERLKLWVIMVIAVNALQTEGRLRFYLLFFLVCFVLFPVRGALVNYATGYHTFGRAIWNYIYNNPNDLAALSLLALGVALAFVFTAPSRTVTRLGAGIAIVLVLVVILLTQSRAAFIGLVVGLGPALVVTGLRRPRLLVPAAIVGFAIAALMPMSVWERLSGIEKLSSEATLAAADPEGSAAQRYEIQKVAWQIFIDNPLFGVGLGTYPLVNAEYAPELGRRDTHNTYLNLAAEVGLPGLLLWCWLVWSVLLLAYRSRRRAGSGELATQQAWTERAFWGYLVACLFGTYAALTFPYLVLAILWCSATLLARSGVQTESAARTARE
jgi:O-antigen ligase